MQNVVDDICEKCAVVTDDNDRLVARDQVVLEPLCRFQIEVVGRFVEQKEVCGM